MISTRLKLLCTPLTLFCSGLLIANPVVAEDPDVNRLLASQCAQCHGTNGYARGDMDGLAGDGDLAEDLLDMKGEDRPENIMDHQALGYTNDQIRRIASYYARLPEGQKESFRGGESSRISETMGASKGPDPDEHDEHGEDEKQERKEGD